MDVTSPPMTTVASGRCTSAPVPCESATGMNPRLATSAVMSTGRRRSRAPSAAATAGAAPCWRARCTVVSSTSPLSTATPNRAMKPMLADTLRCSPRSQSASTPPTAANGRFTSTSPASHHARSDAQSRPAISRTESGTTTRSPAIARCRFSNAPP